MKRIIISLTIGILSALLFTGLTFADTNDFAVIWWTVDGGGEMHSAGGRFTVSGTAGQPDASVATHRGGAYTVQSGFWPPRKTQIYKIFLPIFRWHG